MLPSSAGGPLPHESSILPTVATATAQSWWSRISSRPSSSGGRRRPFACQWDDRHHICESKDNGTLVRTQRRFFDTLVALRVRDGGYVDSCMCNQPRVFDATSTAEDILRRSQERSFRSPMSPPTSSASPGPCAKRCRSPGMSSTWRTVSSTWRSKSRSPQPWEPPWPRVPVTSADLDIEAEIVLGFATPGGVVCRPASRKMVMPQQRASRKNQGVKKEEPQPYRKKKSTSARSSTYTLKANRDLLKTYMNILLELAERPGQEPYMQFLQWVQAKYDGNLHKCWNDLDEDSSLVLSRQELLRQIHNHGFRLNTRDREALWHCLDRDGSGVVKLMHFDPISNIALACVKRWCNHFTGGAEAMAMRFDSDGSGTLSVEEFAVGCEKFGFVHQEFLQCFLGFAGALQSNKLTYDSVRFLDDWDCPEYLYTAKDPEGARILRDLLLSHHQGNAIRAWRRSLDKDASGRLNYLEFKRMVGQLRGMHPRELAGVNTAGVWHYFDEDLSGWLTLGDFDPRGQRLLLLFVRWARREHGSLTRAFKWMEPPDNPEKGIGLGRFTKLLAEPLELVGADVEVLFNGLNLEDGDRMTFNEIRFLERFDPEKEETDRNNWSKLFGARMREATEHLLLLSQTPSPVVKREAGSFSGNGKRESVVGIRPYGHRDSQTPSPVVRREAGSLSGNGKRD